MPEPTPPLDLAALEARECSLAHSCECHNDVPVLLARVRTLEAAVREVATEAPWCTRYGNFVCFYCDRWSWEPHQESCTWVACRALLGVTDA